MRTESPVEVSIKKNKWFSHDSILVKQDDVLIENHDINRIEFGDHVRSLIIKLPDNIISTGVIDLSNCTRLRSLPSGIKASGLVLHKCTELTSVPDDIEIEDIVHLSGCSSLKQLPPLKNGQYSFHKDMLSNLTSDSLKNLDEFRMSPEEPFATCLIVCREAIEDGISTMDERNRLMASFHELVNWQNNLDDDLFSGIIAMTKDIILRYDLEINLDSDDRSESQPAKLKRF